MKDYNEKEVFERLIVEIENIKQEKTSHLIKYNQMSNAFGSLIGSLYISNISNYWRLRKKGYATIMNLYY